MADGLDLWCLGFVDGGVNARTTVVIGGHQMEDNLFQFDLESMRSVIKELKEKQHTLVAAGSIGVP
ncbi:Glc7p regulatory subunit, partial [Turnera subulata]